MTPLAPAAAPATALASTVTIARDTPVELMAPTEITTATAKPGTRFKLRVNKPVLVDGRTVIPVGTPAYGEVVTAKGSAALGVSGKMTTRLIAVHLGDAEIPLEGEMSAKGTGAGSAGMAILFAGLPGLFHRGNNAKIKGGELVAGFIAHEVVLDLSGPKPRLAAAPANAPLTPTAVPAAAPAPVPATRQ